jgi:hypothetical protein
VNAVAPYIPTQQAKFTAWLLNFSTLITAAPATYGLLASDAVIIAGYYSAWLAAYTPVTSPSTKSAAAVSVKNTEYATIIPLIRSYAQSIANNVGVSSAAKIALGLNPKTSSPSKITAPTSTPILLVQFAVAGQIALRYRDSAASPSTKSKPFGVIQLSLVGQVSAAPIVSAAAMPQLVVATKSPLLLPTTGMASGGTLYLSGYWVTRTGLKSGPAPIIATTVV